MISFENDNIFLVTGASSGIGKAIAYKIIELGGQVIALARNLEKLEDAKIKSPDESKFFIEQKDLAEDIDNLDKWFNDLIKKYGKLTGLVLNAGIQQTRPVQSIKIDEVKKLFDINVFANFALVKSFSKRTNNVGQGASIVCISSFVSLIGVPATSIYSASKGALNSFVKTAAIELARYGIRVNSILPGHIITEMLSKESSLNIIELEKKYPLGLGKPEDIANGACFLLSNASSWITGSSLVIDGGASIMY